MPTTTLRSGFDGMPCSAPAAKRPESPPPETPETDPGEIGRGTMRSTASSAMKTKKGSIQGTAACRRKERIPYQGRMSRQRRPRANSHTRRPHGNKEAEKNGGASVVATISIADHTALRKRFPQYGVVSS